MYFELRKHVLFNYDWLHAKLSATSLPDVLADFQMMMTSLESMDPVIRFFSRLFVVHALQLIVKGKTK